MTKQDLVNYVYDTMHEEGVTKINKSSIKAILEVANQRIQIALCEEGKVKLHGLGSLNIVQRAARWGLNPRTLERIRIPSKKAVRFVSNKRAQELADISDK